MSGLCGASALVFAWIFLGVVRTAEALTPLDPCKSLLKEKKKKKASAVVLCFVQPQSSQEAVTWRQQNGFSLIIWTKIITSIHGNGSSNYGHLFYCRKQSLPRCFSFFSDRLSTLLLQVLQMICHCGQKSKPLVRFLLFYFLPCLYHSLDLWSNTL